MRRYVPSALAVCVVVVLGLHASPPGAAMPARSCVRAVMLDGLLRCDEEAPATLADVCGEGGGLADLRIDAGDAIDSTLCDLAEPRRGGPGWGRIAAADLRALDQPVDVNAAHEDELRSLPGIGPKIAGRIVEGRPYDDAEELLRVRGIGPKTLERIRPRIFVDRTPGGAAHRQVVAP